jgi:protein O-GlcNAc transferase
VPQPLTIDETLQQARISLAAGKVAEAAAACANILTLLPDFGPALHLIAQIQHSQGRPERAIEFMRRAARATPKAAEVHNDLANLLQMSDALEESVASYRRALQLNPGYAEAHRNLASALRRLGRVEEAVTELEAAVALNPQFAEAVAQLLHQLKQQCDWDRIDSLTARLIEVVESDAAPVNPFIFLSLDTMAVQQLACARRWAATHLPPVPECKQPLRPPGDRITLGYLSGDFQEHATAHLIAELFVLHDRSRFRVIGYSYGKDDGSATRRRVSESFDSFVDLEHASHAEAAARIAHDGVDILIDLKGYTTDARPEILALRPAPVQVSYLGYPGTLGTKAVDYILVDQFVVPAEEQPNFTEKLVHLPDAYQINDSRRIISSPAPTREQCGLPAAGFVFCCLSASYKITPRMFDIWMRLVEATPDSVLWLLDPGRVAADNLQREADARVPGGASRLVFAPSLPNPDHLARLSVADLFLDTLPYNAHTLASDALWAGCPVLTCSEATFPSRVAGSLLHAIGLPELVTSTLAEYEALALHLARDRDALHAIRNRLRENRLTTPLFDSRRFTRNLEAAFEEMLRP